MARGDEQHANPKSNIEIAQEAAMRPIGEIAAREARHPGRRGGALWQVQGKDRARLHRLAVRPAERQADPRHRDHPDPGRRGQDDDLGRARRCAQPHRQEDDAVPARGEPRSRALASRAARQAAAMPRSCRWRTSTCISPATCMRSAPPTICSRRWSTTTSITGSEPVIDPRRVTWRRAIDMNDRALRSIVSSLGGVANGFPREDGFDITAASQVMATFCLATDLQDLQRRLGNIVVGQTRARKPVRAAELKAAGSMAVLLKDALAPNLVQTLENNPVFIHGGPFANIAHGCNSVIATTSALKLADYVVTEAGFGADLGAEKFFDIKCRQTGLKPDAAVIVATVRALKMHGGVARDALREENLAALESGFANLARHLTNLRQFGVPTVVSVNRFSSDTAARARPPQGAVRGARGSGGDWRPLGARQRGSGRSRPRRRRSCRERGGQFPLSLSGRDAAVGQDPHDRAADLRRPRHRCRQAGERPARRFGGAGLWAFPGVHRQDPVQLYDRPEHQRERRATMW